MELLIDFTPAEGAVIRILGLIERRGFLLRDLAVRGKDQSSSLTVELEPRDHSRRLEVLARQVGRLVDVKSVSIPPTPAGPGR